MKNVKTLIAAVVLGSLSFASMAAELVNSEPAQQQKIGVISVTGGSNLSSVENKLADKAAQSGAKSFQITSVSGQDRLHGTAVIYQ